MSKNLAVAHLRKQLKQLTEKPVHGFSVEVIDDDITKWRIWIRGIRGTPYEGGIFRARMEFPADFPFLPPTLIFESKMWHPNIYADGKVCISILHPPGEDQFGYEEASERWSPIQSVESVLISVISMLCDPNDQSPANIDAAIEWRKKPAEYNKRCRQLAEKANAELPKDFVPPLDFDNPASSSSSSSSATSSGNKGEKRGSATNLNQSFGDDMRMDEDEDCSTPNNQFKSQLKSLKEMGLINTKEDEARCVKLLEKHKGELEKVIGLLL